MYKIFAAIFIILVLFLILNYCRKKQIIERVSHMPMPEKCKLLNQLSKPFGFCYDARQDVFSTRIDAWQKTFGYGRLYDMAASSMNMILDTEPIYFNYRHRTWLIQFWKGQYGITTGAEIGVYHADSVIAPMLRDQTIFQAVPEEEMLPLRIQLSSRRHPLFYFFKDHWWLTGFCIGKWCPPSHLEAKYAVTFPDMEMCDSFLASLTKIGYTWNELQLEGTTVYFTFSTPRTPDSSSSPKWWQQYVLWKDRLFCWFYQKLTSPFSCTADKLLYLYYYLPYAFRRTVCPRTFKKHTFLEKTYNNKTKCHSFRNCSSDDSSTDYRRTR